MALDYKSSLARYRRYLQVTSERPLWRASLFVIFSLVLILFMVLFALRPTLITISGLLGEIKQRKEVAQKLSLKIAAVAKAAEILEDKREKMGLLTAALPINPAWEEWAGGVIRMASESGVVVKSVNVEVRQAREQTPLPEGVGSISFSLIGVGQYSQIYNWLVKLENLPRMVVIEDIQMAKNSDNLVSVSVTGWIGYEKITTR